MSIIEALNGAGHPEVPDAASEGDAGAGTGTGEGGRANEGLGAALLRCVEFVERCARAGFRSSEREPEDPGGSESSRVPPDVLQSSFQLIRGSLFSNWLAVQGEQQSRARLPQGLRPTGALEAPAEAVPAQGLQPVPYREMVGELEERLNAADSDATRLQRELAALRADLHASRTAAEAREAVIAAGLAREEELRISEDRTRQLVGRQRKDLIMYHDELKTVEVMRDELRQLLIKRSDALAVTESRNVAFERELAELDSMMRAASSEAQVLKASLRESEDRRRAAEKKIAQLLRVQAAAESGALPQVQLALEAQREHVTRAGALHALVIGSSPGQHGVTDTGHDVAPDYHVVLRAASPARPLREARDGPAKN